MPDLYRVYFHVNGEAVSGTFESKPNAMELIDALEAEGYGCRLIDENLDQPPRTIYESDEYEPPSEAR